MSRRARIELYEDVLKEIKSGTNLPTRIMYGANLSWVTLKQILERLTVHGFIEEKKIEGDSRSKHTYNITDKGDTALNYLNRLNELVAIKESTETPI